MIDRKNLAAMIAFCVLLAAGPALSQQMFKCGATYQDRPCADKDVQQRFSRAAGTFSVEQVNAETDKDCARLVRDVMPYWQRMSKGETFEQLKSEIDAQRIGGDRKAQMRDGLLALREFKGQEPQVRSQLENNCMAYKRRQGYATEKEMAEAESGAAMTGSARDRASIAAQRRAAIAAERAARAAERARMSP